MTPLVNDSYPPVIYIVSPNYSGSTLLTFLLATHSEVGTLGERYQFYRRVVNPDGDYSHLCSCLRPFHECSFWTTVRDLVFSQMPSQVRAYCSDYDFTRFRFHGHPFIQGLLEKFWLTVAVKHLVHAMPVLFLKRFAAYCAGNAHLISAVLQTGGHTVFLDSSKNVRYLIYLNALSSGKFCALHLSRDGRAQVYSVLKRSPSTSVEQAAEHWSYAIHRQIKLLEKWGGPTLRVKYEELCAFPAKTVQDVLQFCGLEPEEFSKEFRNYEHHIMGNPMRLRNSQEIVDKQDWRARLSAEQLAAFDKIAGATNNALGYS